MANRSDRGMKAYGLFLGAYPRSFRERFSSEMRAHFAEELREARAKGTIYELALWIRTTRDTAWLAVGEWVAMLTRASADLGTATRDGSSSFGRPRAPETGGPDSGPGGLSGIWDDVRYAVRRLRRTPLTTAVAVVVAGIGVGATTATFSVLDAVLLRPLPYPEPDQLVQVWETNPAYEAARGIGWSDLRINAQVFLDYESQARSFSGMAWTMPYTETGQGTIGGGDGAPQVVGAHSVSPSFLSVLGITLPLGRTFLPEETAPVGDYSYTPVVIISHDMWATRFASDPDILGKDVLFEGGPSTVVGVLPRDFRFPPLSDRGEVRETDVAVLLPLFYEAFNQPRSFRQFTVIARMRPGVTIASARAEMDRLAGRVEAEYPDLRTGWRPMVTPLHGLLARDYGLVFYSLMGMVGFVLLVACANLASLALAQGTRRRAELALRAAIGGGRVRLFRLLMTESLLLALFGGLLGVFLAHWGTTALLSVVPAEVPRAAQAGVDGRVLTFALAVSLATGVLFGLVPALRSSDVDLHRDLKGGGRTGAGLGWTTLSRSLITVQVALTLVLLMGGGLLAKSFLRLSFDDLGYTRSNVLMVTLHRGRHHRYGFGHVNFVDLEARRERWRASTEIMERVRALPGIRSVATGDVPLNRTGYQPVQFRPYDAEDSPGETVSSFVEYVSPEYFTMLDIPIVRGQGLPEWTGVDDADRYWWAIDGPDCVLEAKESGDPSRADRTEYCVGPPVLVSETFAATAWPREDPIGKELGVYGCCWRVAGVVADVDFRGVDAPPVPGRLAQTPEMVIYVPYTELGPYLIKTDLDPSSLVPRVRDVIASVEPDAPVTFETLERRVADSLARPRFYSLVAAIFAGVALVMALVGLYGVMAYFVSRRVHEIGIRMALGAERGQIRTMVVSQGIRPVIAGVALGLAASASLAGLLDSLLYGMDALDPWVALGVPVAMIGVSIGACYGPARRASQVNPVRALAHE